MKKFLTLPLISTSIITVNSAVLADITIPAGTIIQNLDTSSNVYGISGAEQIFYQADPYIRKYKFNQDTSCNLDGKFTGAVVFGHAFTQKCLELTGAFISETDNGSTIIGKEDAILLKRTPEGELHIGENSAVFKEENGREKF